ncbi:unnamed protein product [Gemmataceae bacterium]|nr:unnamed protein product [Gemmataceae bacterium]VTT98895.1 unnamed protein product [Gemmataceae bacterium]
MLLGLLAWAWGGVGPWLVWVWWAAVAPTLQCVLNCFGLVWLWERFCRWWIGE